MIQQQYPGNLYVLSAPSGAGKSSLVRALIQKDPHIRASISHTTRPPRGQEIDGQDYFFVTSEQFNTMLQQHAFLESALVHGNHYGTSKQAVIDTLEKGQDILLEIDYQGALQVKRLFPQATLIFILPPSMAELEKRLRSRGEDDDAVISQRLHNATYEIKQVHYFDYVIINEFFETALQHLSDIVYVQRLKYASQQHKQAHIFRDLNII